MKIELKRISYNKRLSHETPAFAADVWVDGVKRGTVENDGNGGSDRIFPYALRAEIDAYAKTLPPVKAYGHTLPMDAELIFGDLLDKHLLSKDLQRILKAKTVFTKADGHLYERKGIGLAAPADAVKVLNQIPFEEALEIYSQAVSPK
jgi:hypothetical protein